MNRPFGIPLSIVAAALLAACADQPAAPIAAPGAAVAPLLSAAPRAEVIPGRYIVVFRDDVGSPAELAARLVAEHGGKLHYTYQHGIKGFAATLPARAVEGLRHNPRVAYIEPDQVARATGTQSSAPWNLDRIDQRDVPRDGLYNYNKTGAGVRVYVIDSGIYTAHPDFGTPSRARFGFDACHLGDCSSGDGIGHGTKVAGIVGSATFGVAKGVEMVSVRVFRTKSSPTDTVNLASTSSIMSGVAWVTANHVKPAVANMSIGVAESQALEDAVRASITAGVTYVVAAGNSNVDACDYSPAGVAEAITVGGSDRIDAKWSGSNHGSCVDVYAPGTALRSTTRTGGFTGESTTDEGTSYAAPHVAGYAAMLLEWVPTMTPASVHSAVINYSTTGRLTGLPAGSHNRLLYTVFGQKTRSVES